MTGEINFRGKVIKYNNQPEYFKQIESGEWEVSTFDVLDKYLKEGSVFVDCGAWVGALSVYAALLGAKVYAIEPDYVSFMELVNNISVNNLSYKIQVDEIAISNENGTSFLRAHSFGHSQSSLIETKNATDLREVNTIDLGIFLDVNKLSNIDLIKIDIEASEQLLINSETIRILEKHNLPKILISFHPTEFKNKKETVDKIIELFFSVYSFVGVDTPDKYYYEDDFIKAMYSSYDHTFLLLPKQK